MQVHKKVEDFQFFKQPLVLTIGNFDGMHLGHQAVLEKVQTLAGLKGQTAMLTFENHPSTILRPQNPTYLLFSLPHKLYLIQKFCLDHLILIPFTKNLAHYPADLFIEYLRQFIPFSDLVLGYDSTIGHARQGNQMIMQELAEKKGFTVTYVEEYQFQKQVVSSTHIRKAIQQTDFEKASSLLGRPYSIYGPVVAGKKKGKEIGYATANIEVTRLCLPPFGVYAVEAEVKNKKYLAVANLGRAPTLGPTASPLLEVHLFDFFEEIYNEKIEVFFKKFIRFEKKFHSSEALRQQISEDIIQAKKV